VWARFPFSHNLFGIGRFGILSSKKIGIFGGLSNFVQIFEARVL
jgi:hypothetical protein